AGQSGVLVFETDAAGKVVAWRVGLPPQVDYVEGCG
ncbi:lectin, partial [Pantoea dispersa]